jgi:ribosomal protein S18 acetylase RimI-like enzyme
MNEAPPSVQPLAAADVDAVSALARSVWQATYPALIPQAQIDAMLADRYAPQRIREQLGDPHQGWWVAKQDHALAGFVHALLDESGCTLDKLYVHPDRQRRGIGAALAKTVEDWGRRQQVHRLWLQVNRGNTRAIAAYEKYGFRIVESRVFELGGGFVMDDHVMERML